MLADEFNLSPETEDELHQLTESATDQFESQMAELESRSLKEIQAVIPAELRTHVEEMIQLETSFSFEESSYIDLRYQQPDGQPAVFAQGVES